MKISCPACAAKYSIADEKVSDRLAKIRCRKCNATIVIDGKASPPNVYTAAGEATAEASEEAGDSQAAGLQFTVDFGEGDQRTMSVPEVLEAYNAGQITQDTYLWADGFADWKPLSEVDEVVSALSAAAPAPAAAAPAAASWASAAASPARAAARSGGRAAPAADLFGGIEAAGGEDEVATSAPDPSASRGGGLGLGAASSSTANGTGSRNESSVLFSLSALTSAASRPSSRPIASAVSASGAATRDDSGLIDLKALTAAATKSESSAAAPLVAPLGLSPLAAPPLGIAAPFGGGLGAPAADYGTPAARNKNGLYIGGGIAVAAIAAVAIVFMLRPPPPAPAPAPVVAAPVATPAPTPEPAAPAPAADTTATPPSTGVAAAEDAPKTPTSKAAGTVKRPASGSGSTTTKKAGSTAAPAETPAAAPKPKRNPCGCASGDLQCAMRCAAG